MTDLIRAFAALLRLAFRPRSLRTSAVVPPAPPAPRPRRTPALLPGLRSPYGLDTPLKGEDVALIRPYLVAYEERQRQRRRALVMAAHFGLELDTRVIHGVGVA